jgi:beta-glucosidase
LRGAVSKHLVSEKEIDTAVKRLFTARYRLGMFDPPERVKYTRIPFEIVDSKEHHELALEATRESIVLLKNDKNVLPLKKNIGTIAVIGPNSDDWLMLLGNYNGTPSDPVTPLKGIRQKVSSTTKVLFSQGCQLAEGLAVFNLVPTDVLFAGENEHGLRVEYYNNKDLHGVPLFASIEKNIDDTWFDKAPRKDIDDDNFGVRWSGELRPDQSGMYQLGFISTCKTRLYLNDSLLAKTVYHFRDEYGDPRLRKSEPLKLEAGKRYKIALEAGESYGDAQVRLVWGRPAHTPRAVEIARQADVVVMCMGLSARMEGEEMNIDINGFKGGDRTRLDLPDVQQELIKEIHALGKPIVLVLLNGSALAVNWENENVPAIVEAWYPGQAAGQAIADVLFGDYNPGGRLPVTFYKSVNDLPPFTDYSMNNRSYRYFKGEPLYPFGYGLSYTSFTYENLKVDKTCEVGDTLRLSVQVKNTGSLAGDEVAQVYVSNLSGSVSVPLRSLAGFKRVHLRADEEKTIEFAVPPDAFSVFNAKNERVVLPGKFEISVGGGQPEKKGTSTTPKTLNARIDLR